MRPEVRDTLARRRTRTARRPGTQARGYVRNLRRPPRRLGRLGAGEGSRVSGLAARAAPLIVRWIV